MHLYNERLDLALAKLSIRYRPVRVWFAFYGLMRYRHYNPLRAWRVARNSR